MATQPSAPGRRYSFPKPITTERQLYTFVALTFGVTIPALQVCPEHTTPWRAFADAYFARTPASVWKASRGFGGKSFLLSLLSLTELITLDAEVNLLGGSGQQSKRVLEAMTRLWSAPAAPRALIADQTQHTTRLNTGAQVQALMASQASVRGPHPQRLRLDEVDEMDLDILDAALGQPMSKNGVRSHTVASSTHQHADGTMTEMLKRASERGWGIYEWCYRESMRTATNRYGWLEEEEVAAKRLVIPDAMWRTEYEGQEPNPEARAFSPDAITAMFKSELGSFTGMEPNGIEIEPPNPDGTYAHGADWARKVDRTILTTYRTDVKPMRLVAFRAMRRLPWPVMVDAFDQRVKRYGGKSAHDQTGLGDVVHGIMRSAAEGVILSGRDRADILSDYVNAVEKGEYECPDIALMRNEHKYASVDDLYASGKDHHLPDTVCSAALAHKVGARRLRAAFASA